MARSKAYFQQRAATYARGAGVDPGLFQRQIGAESGFNPGARSGAGAVGIAQIVPRWHPDVNPNMVGNQAPGQNPEWDLQYAAGLMGRLEKKYGNYKDALSVYNSGRPWKIGQGISETKNYVSKILGGHEPAVANNQGPPQGNTTYGGGGSRPRALASFMLEQGQRLSTGQGFDVAGLLGAVQEDRRQAAESFTGMDPGGEDPNDPRVKMAPSAAFTGPGGSKRARKVVQTAEKYLGTYYKWGGESPATGFDCSGLLQYSWGQKGVNIPRTSQEQWKVGKRVDLGGLQPGDALFFGTSGTDPHHVGMYVGGGKFIEAPHTGAKVRISALGTRGDYMGARRYG